jgi:hypothetical protein
VNADIRIFLSPSNLDVGQKKVDGGQMKVIEHYLSAAVPRIGEMICVQGSTCEVYRVEWTILRGQPHADVFCDGSELP